MTQNCEKIKTLLEQLSTAHIPASARLIAVLQELGIEAPSDLERLSGLRPSSVRLAKKQITEQRQPASAAGQRSPLARQPASAAGQRSSRARAYKESPSEIVNNKIITTTTTDTLSTLNGSADVVVGYVSSWMTAYHETERDRAARQWIATEIARTSSDAVKQAVLLTANKLQSGDLITQPLRFTTGTATRLHATGSTAAACANKPTALEAYRAAKAAGKLGAIHG